MPMDATALTASVKELNEASAGGKTEVSYIGRHTELITRTSSGF